MQPVKVFHIILTLRSGGAEKQLVEVVNGTSRNGFSHRICALQDSGFFGPEMQKNGHDVIDLGLEGKHPWFRAARAIDALIERDPPDIIHSWMFDANVVSRLVKLRYRKIPLVTSLQAPDYEPKAIRLTGWSPTKIAGLRMIDKTLAMLTGPYFIACSDFVAESYKRNFGIRADRMSVIYNSVSPGPLQTAPGEAESLRESLGIARDTFVYINVGRFDPQKDQKLLLRAFQKVHRQNAGTVLVIVGSGPLENDLRELAASLEITDSVLFLSNRKDIGALLEMSDAYVFPSVMEGLPLALLEAMLKGCACVASDIEPHREAIENGVSGLLVALGDADGLADSMLRLYNDAGLREKLGAAAAETIGRKFFSSLLIPKWEAVYEMLANRS
jgi:glycosyltransferase involved in cell wall biosynthesis